MPHPLVTNIRNDGCEVYVGRPSKYGNPFPLKRESERTAVLEQYRAWLHAPEQAELRGMAKVELKGRVLGCWCAPKPCHADVLAELVNGDA